MELLEAIYNRKSIRKFKEDAIPENHIKLLLDAARWAPSGGNQQPWYFVVITSSNVKQQIRQAIRSKVEEIADWAEAKEYEQLVRVNTIRASTFFGKAPVAIAVFSKSIESFLDSVLEKHVLNFEERKCLRGFSDMLSIGAAIQNLLLVAHSLGYGACWMTGPAVAYKAIGEILGVESPWQFRAIIALGIPAEDPRGRSRKPLDSIYQII